MHIFYTPNIQGDQYTLSEQESKHAVRVLRVNAGDEVLLTNGKGSMYHAKVDLPNAKRCQLSILSVEKEYGKLPYELHIAICPTKNTDRLEWFLEKVTEIGIHEITPIIGFHSERKIIKPERLEKVIIAATKQSLKGYKPILNPLTTFKDFISRNPQNLAIAHCNDGEKTPLKDYAVGAKNITIMIGPEGDFSLEEVKLAIESGATPIDLGESRLRTETAGIVACHTVNLIHS